MYYVFRMCGFMKYSALLSVLPFAFSGAAFAQEPTPTKPKIPTCTIMLDKKVESYAILKSDEVDRLTCKLLRPALVYGENNTRCVAVDFKASSKKRMKGFQKCVAAEQTGICDEQTQKSVDLQFGMQLIGLDIRN